MPDQPRVLRTHALEQLHLVVQDVPVGQNESFLVIRHIGGVEHLPAELVQSLRPFSRVARYAAGAAVEPRVGTAPRQRRDVVTSESLATYSAAVRAHELVSSEQRCIRQRDSCALVALRAPPSQHQNAFQRDLRVKPCVAVLTASERELVVAKAICNLTESFLADGILPKKPPRRET